MCVEEDVGALVSKYTLIDIVFYLFGENNLVVIMISGGYVRMINELLVPHSEGFNGYSESHVP